MSEELRLCPFCGEMPIGQDDRYMCSTLGCVMQENTISAKDWNTRPIEDALTARIAELEAENNRLQDAWFRDETICPDGSLKPKVSTLLNRIAELEAAQRWIPVSEPPKVSGKYLLLNIYDDVYPCDFIAGTEIWVLPDYDTITHWMPLPQPPEVQE